MDDCGVWGKLGRGRSSRPLPTPRTGGRRAMPNGIRTPVRSTPKGLGIAAYFDHSASVLHAAAFYHQA